MLHRIVLLGTVLLFWGAMALATVAGVSSEDKIRQNLKENFPDLKVNNIVLSPVSPFYQVNAGAIVFYVSPDGRFLLSGEMIDLKNQKKNITETARQDIRVGLLKAVSTKDLLSFSPAKKLYTVNVFTDLDCKYCHDFHQQMAKLNELGVEVNYLAFPRQGLGSPSYDKATWVWCAANRQEAFNKAYNGETLERLSCKNPVEEEFKLGISLGINGTPSIIFEDGSVLPGFAPAEQIAKMAEAAYKRAHPNG